MKKLTVLLMTVLILFLLCCCTKEVKSTGSEVLPPMDKDYIDNITEYPDYKAFEGDFFDKTSKRATLIARENDDFKSVNIKVSWGNSAFETIVWEMNGEFDGEKLNYSDLKKYSENENGKTLLEENISGYFETDADMNLYWTGAKEENCKQCIFERFNGDPKK